MRFNQGDRCKLHPTEPGLGDGSQRCSVGNLHYYCGVGGLSPPWGQGAPSCLPPVWTEEPWAQGEWAAQLGLPSARNTHLLRCVLQQHQLGVEVRGAQAGGGPAAPRRGGGRSHSG